MRTCTKCKEMKPLTEGFYYETRSAKYLTVCKACVSAYNKDRRRTIPEVAEASRASSLKWQRTAKALDPERNTWARKTPEQKRKACLAVLKWRKLNPAKAAKAAKESLFATRLKRSKPFQKAWPIILEHYGLRCLACGSLGKVCFDHVVPVALNGANALTNGQPLCIKCNTFKGATDRSRDYRPDQGAWIAELVRLNPWLETLSRPRGWHLSWKGKGELEEARRLAEEELAMPEVDRVPMASEVQPIQLPAIPLSRTQLQNKRILDSLLANLPKS